ncbi:hypothetical protein ACW4TU_31815 [Streptomyces sp. QTS52]
MPLLRTSIRRRTPAQDIEDFENGQALRVLRFTENIGGTVTQSVGKDRGIARLMHGHLRPAVGEAPLWSDRRGDRTATLRPPFRPKLTAGKVPMAPGSTATNSSPQTGRTTWWCRRSTGSWYGTCSPRRRAAESRSLSGPPP